MSEAELHILAGRLQESKRAAARRGELRCPLPVGYVFDDEGHTVVDFHEEIRAAVADVFTAFEATGSAYGVVGRFHNRLFPRRAYGGVWAGEIRWGRLTHGRVCGLLSNPAYAGSYVFGRYQSQRFLDPEGTIRVRLVERPRSEWPVLIQDHHPAYISWETFLANEQRLAANYTRSGARPPREGTALLQGMVLCGSCGRAMSVGYPGGRATYDCAHSRSDHTKTPGCRSMLAAIIDAAVARRVLAVVCWRIAQGRGATGSGRAARAPMAVLLLFGGLLFPALGFVDVYPFRFSFVADHFQYLASMAAIAAFASIGRSSGRAITRLAGPNRGLFPDRSTVRSGSPWRDGSIARSVEVLLILLLAALTWRQASLYADADTIYRETLRRNPTCWLCANNLGVLRPPDRVDEALALFQQAIRLNPQYAEAHNNVGTILQQRGDLRAAIAEYRLALAAEPDYPAARRNLGLALAAYAPGDPAGRTDAAAEAVVHLREALRDDPADPAVHYSLGLALVARDPGQALERFQEAIRLNPGLAEAHNSAGNLLLRFGRVDEAIVRYTEALRLKPDFADAHYNLGNAYLHRAQADQAMAEYREAVRLNPAFPEPHNTIGNLLRRAGRSAEAIAEYRTALRLDPTFGDAAFNLGNALYQSRQPADAVRAFRQALAARPGDADAHNNLGLALEALGRVDEAAAEYREALRANPQMTEARSNLERLRKR